MKHYYANIICYIRTILFKFLNLFCWESAAFLSIVLFELIHIVSLVVSHRMVIHDTFYALYAQYYFLNNAVISGEIPLWIPYLTHGISSSMWQGIVGIGGVAHNAVLLFAPLLKGGNFLPIFYSNVFFDIFVLLLGTWLLAKRFFVSLFSVWFVTFTVITSSVWMSQIYFNLWIFYAFPLIVYLLHRFLDTAKWRYLVMALNFLALQFIYKPAYFISITTLTIFLYFIFYVIFNFLYVVGQMKRLRFNDRAWGALILIVASFVLAYVSLQAGMDKEITLNIQGRGLKGEVPLSSFLTYGALISFRSWLDIFFGFSISHEITNYMGILTVPFFCLAFLFGNIRKKAPFVLLILVCLLFSAGTFVAKFFYYCWPLTKYFRHISALYSVARFLICFLAGFGVDGFIRFLYADNKNRRHRFIFISITAGLFLGAIGVLKISRDTTLIRTLFETMGFPDFEKAPAALLDQTAFVIKTVYMKMLECAVLFGAALLVRNTKQRTVLLFIILGFHFVDCTLYLQKETQKRTFQLDSQQYSVLNFQEMPYHEYREQIIGQNNPRNNIITTVMERNSSLIWTVDAFLFNEQIGTRLRTDFWMRPFDKYLKSVWRQPFDDPLIPLKEMKYQGFRFPAEHKAASKFSGLSISKIQLFDRAYLINDEQKLSELISDPSYEGDMLILSHPKNSTDPQLALFDIKEAASLHSQDRLDGEYQISKYDANNLELVVNNTRNHPIWLFYSDVWHPSWHAAVNGKAVDVYKALFAYKAISLFPGNNHVHFFFYSTHRIVIHFLTGLNSLVWMLIFLGMFWSNVKCETSV